MRKLNGYEPYRESEFKNHIAELEESVKAWEKIYTYVAELEAKNDVLKKRCEERKRMALQYIEERNDLRAKNAALEKQIETLKVESIKHSLDFASEYAAMAKRVSEED